jgi:hypothetical protein
MVLWPVINLILAEPIEKRRWLLALVFSLLAIE